jgi:hypothetical protein
VRVPVTSHHPPTIESNVTTRVEEYECGQVVIGTSGTMTLGDPPDGTSVITFDRGNWSHVEIMP